MSVYMISFPNLVLVPCCLLVHAVLHRGPQARVYPVVSLVYMHDTSRWWTQGCTYDTNPFAFIICLDDI
jgi:hypothetical protein